MENLPMCRICLGTNARMNILLDTYLQEIYEELTAMPLITMDKRPTLACYICSARLKTCYQLKMKCLQSEKFFTQILQSNVMESTKLENISRTDALRITPVAHFSMGDVVQENELHSVHVEVKQEPLETEVTVKQEDSEDNENEFRQEYYITLEDMQPISSDNFIMDTAPVKSEVDVLRVKSETSTPTLAKKNAAKSTNVAVVSNTRNNALYDKEKLKLEENSYESYKCSVCPQRFNKKSSLVKHNCKPTVVKKHQCEVCLNVFCSTSSLRRHTSRAHNCNTSHECDICGKSFIWKDDLTTHIHLHKKLHQCNICKKMYSSKNSLRKHLYIIHTRNIANNSYVVLKLFTCDICKKDFTYKDYLVRHMRTHTGEKPYQCDVCKKSFSERSTLNKHVLVHGYKKRFQCDICDKGFKQKSHLESHSSAHWRKTV